MLRHFLVGFRQQIEVSVRETGRPPHLKGRAGRVHVPGADLAPRHERYLAEATAEVLAKGRRWTVAKARGAAWTIEIADEAAVPLPLPLVYRVGSADASLPPFP